MRPITAGLAAHCGNIWIGARFPGNKELEGCGIVMVRAFTTNNPATVHNGVHYMQPGYNEIGIVCADKAEAHLR